MSKEKVNVIIDSNEASQNPKMTEVFVLHDEVEDYSIEPLSEGDIKIENCLFERKEPSDFASSLQEGRLKEQTERMGGREESSFILVEGDMSDFNNLKHTQIPAKSLRGMTASIIARNKIPVVFCSKPETLADMAVRLARKTVEEPSGVQTKTTETVKEPSFMENVFLGIGGIGYKTATKLVEKYDSLSSLQNTTIEEIQEVEGVGSKTAKEIYEKIESTDSNGENNNEEEGEESVEVVTI